jgi:hypothetical protein
MIAFVVRSASGGLDLCRFTFKIANYSDMSAEVYTQGYFSPVFLFPRSYQHGVWTLSEYR